MTALPQSGTFAMVDPTHVREVGAAAALVYARILWRNEAGPWRSTRRDLADEVGLSLGALRTAVEVLRSREWITTTRVSSTDATLIWEPVRPAVAQSADSAGGPCRIQPTPPADSATSSYETGTDLLDTPPTPQPDAAAVSAPSRALAVVPDLQLEVEVPTAADALETEFAEFWQRYPRKVGKKAARAAWTKARKRAPLAVIAQGLLAQLPSMAARRIEVVPYPASWLNGDRWEDQAEHVGRGDAADRPRSRNHLLDLQGRGQEALDGMLQAPAPFPARPALEGPRR